MHGDESEGVRLERGGSSEPQNHWLFQGRNESRITEQKRLESVKKVVPETGHSQWQVPSLQSPPIQPPETLLKVRVRPKLPQSQKSNSSLKDGKGQEQGKPESQPLAVGGVEDQFDQASQIEARLGFPEFPERTLPGNGTIGTLEEGQGEKEVSDINYFNCIVSRGSQISSPD